MSLKISWSSGWHICVPFTQWQKQGNRGSLVLADGGKTEVTNICCNLVVCNAEAVACAQYLCFRLAQIL